MDRLLVTLTRKYLNIDVDSSADEDSHLRTKILMDVIELLRCLIKNQAERGIMEKEVPRNIESIDLPKDIGRTTAEVEKWTFHLWKQRSRSIRFRRNAEQDWKAWMFARRNVEENLMGVFAMKTAEFSLNVSCKNLKSEMQRKSIEREIRLLEFRTMTMLDTHRSKETDLCDARFEKKKRCLDQLAQYDDNVGTLYRCKMSLLLSKNIIEEEYTVIQNRLIEQRSLYDRLQEERALTIMKASLAKLQNFRENRAAKIIQQNWRLYLVRVSSKKKKGKK